MFDNRNARLSLKAQAPGDPVTPPLLGLAAASQRIPPAVDPIARQILYPIGVRPHA